MLSNNFLMKFVVLYPNLQDIRNLLIKNKIVPSNYIIPMVAQFYANESKIENGETTLPDEESYKKIKVDVENATESIINLLKSTGKWKNIVSTETSTLSNFDDDEVSYNIDLINKTFGNVAIDDKIKELYTGDKKDFLDTIKKWLPLISVIVIISKL